MYITIRRRHLLAAAAVVVAVCLGLLCLRIPHSQAAQTGAWGLSFREEGKAPVGNAAAEELKQWDAYYLGNEQAQAEKKIYLTFDVGYENGYTASILDVLKKHQAPAAFFVVGNFVESEPELVRRMAEEGHVVGNHTNTHPDMSAISDLERFSKEIDTLAEKVEAATGKPMEKFYRPPRGAYSTENLRMAQQLGYTTVFWSLAYVDWYVDDQPTPEQAFSKLIPRIHPGAVVLLHSTSATNAQILDELLTRWEEMGYSFASIRDLALE